MPLLSILGEYSPAGKYIRYGNNLQYIIFKNYNYYQ
jgi:hypothetical protein